VFLQPVADEQQVLNCEIEQAEVDRRNDHHREVASAITRS
jgi:hypothetical protein